MDRADIDARFRIVTIIWLALMMGVATFGVVAYGLVATGNMGEPTMDAGLMNLIVPLAVVLMAGGLVLGRTLEGQIPRDAEAEVKIQRYQTARIVTLAMQEGPALMIIVVAMLAGAATWIAVGAALGVASMFIARPNRDDLEGLLRG